MGFCSGTQIFDDAMEEILKIELPEAKQILIVMALIDALDNHDWDCHQDSAYYENPIVNRAIQNLHPDWFDEDEE